jgi:ACT domain-containing protein
MKDKKLIIAELRKTPIVQIACQKIGTSRTTFYRWKKEDEQFAKEADEALQEGVLLINDAAESQLLSAIKDKNMTAIIFWLKHHHLSYTTKLEITSVIKKELELNNEQEQAIQKALGVTNKSDTHE